MRHSILHAMSFDAGLGCSRTLMLMKMDVDFSIVHYIPSHARKRHIHLWSHQLSNVSQLSSFEQSSLVDAWLIVEILNAARAARLRRASALDDRGFGRGSHLLEVYANMGCISCL